MGRHEIKLPEAASIVSARDKVLVNLKETMKTCEQVFYNMGFKDIENLVGAVVFQVRRFGFSKGWMAAMNAIGLPKSFALRDASQIPLPNNSPMDIPTQKQPEDDGDEEEREDSPNMEELA